MRTRAPLAREPEPTTRNRRPGTDDPEPTLHRRTARRDETLTLLARLFAESSFDYAGQYPQIYHEWLLRFTDTAPQVRLKMVQVPLSDSLRIPFWVLRVGGD